MTRTRRASLFALAFLALSRLPAHAASPPFNSSSVASLGGNCAVQGSIMVQSSAGRSICLGAGVSGQALESTGPGADPHWATLTGTGTVTSVGITMPAPFTVSGSPITTAGTLAIALASESANTIFAAPDGAAGAPVFRALTATDMSALLAANNTWSGTQNFTNATNSTSPTTGGVTLGGGLGVSGNINAVGTVMGMLGLGVNNGANLGGHTWAQINSAYPWLAASAGAALAWNYSGGEGETVLLSNHGPGGSSGLAIYDFPPTSGPLTKLFAVRQIAPYLEVPAFGASPGALVSDASGNITSGTLAVANGGTGTATPSLVAGTGMAVSGSFPAQTVALATPVTVANGGTGTATPGLVAGSGITVTGAWPNQTIAATGPTWQLLATLTASNSATVSDTTDFTSNYSRYRIVVSNYTVGTTNTQALAQVYCNGAYVTSNVYFENYTTVNTSLPAPWALATSYNTTGVTYQGTMDLMGFNQNYLGSMTEQGSGGYAAAFQIGSTTAGVTNCTGIKFYQSAGNILTGTFKIYGWNG